MTSNLKSKAVLSPDELVAPYPSESTPANHTPLTPAKRRYYINFPKDLDLDKIEPDHPFPPDLLEDYPSCCLRSDDQNFVLLKPEQTIEVVEVLHSGTKSTVYRAQCLHSNGSTMEVAIKFASRDAIRHEAGNYIGFLTELQGSVVPRYYGVLYGFKPECGDDDYVMCMILEHFGNRLDRSFAKLKSMEK